MNPPVRHVIVITYPCIDLVSGDIFKETLRAMFSSFSGCVVHDTYYGEHELHDFTTNLKAILRQK